MRIAINGLFLQEPRSSVAEYTRHLLHALGRIDGINDYLILTPRDIPDMPETPSSFQWQTVPVGRVRRGGARIEKLVWEQHTFLAAAKRERARVLHIPHFAPLLLRAQGLPIVTTIHDVVALKLPAYRASPTAAAYMRLAARAAKQASMIITPSEWTKRDIMETLRLPSERIRVVPLAPAPRYRRIVDASRLQDARRRHGLAERFVLYVGDLDVRKNLATLVAAFAAVFHELGDPQLQLFIASAPERLGSSPLYPDWRPLAATLGVAQNIHCAKVAEDDKPLLYSAATCFVFPSLYEGFGMQPLEAMACGAPVVCSERSSLPEVVGSAGLLVNPEDEDALGHAIKRVLDSQELREDLRARAHARVKQFGWDQVAINTTAVYTDVAEARS
jgi:glycosyltransferase involved in cell wall biosynthesis